MPADRILALDQGTSSSRAIVFDSQGRALASSRREFRQIFPNAGWVEHDADEIWSSQLETAREAISSSGGGAERIAAIGITNQRETVVLWERASGRPVAHALVWQDRRTAEELERLRAEGTEAMVSERTGLVLDPYFSATKIAWLLDHVRGARARAERGELAAGTIDSWLLWNLSGGRTHSIEIGNASRTLLANLRTGEWDDELLKLFRVPREVLPTIAPSEGLHGTALARHFGAEIPVTGIAGDQQAALFGQLCTRPGTAKCTYGTGCFLLVNTGREPIASRARLLSTIAWRRRESPIEYALEGSVFTGGSAIQWLRDGLGIISKSSDVNELAGQVPDSGGVTIVPAFTGLGAPYWDPHIARATLEAIAFQVSDLHDAMVKDLGRPVTELRVDGGASASDGLMQFQSDLLGVRVERPKDLETTARGAAMMAGLGAGLWRDLESLARQRSVDRSFSPSMPGKERTARLERWHRAVERSRGWAGDTNS